MSKKSILFEGDSWFAYPETFDGVSNVYERFKYINGSRNPKDQYKIALHESNPANLSGTQKAMALPSNGDTLANMVKDDNPMWRVIKKGGNIKAIVISAGGNDILDNINPKNEKNEKNNILKPYKKNKKPADLINQTNMIKLMNQISKNYGVLIKFCSRRKIHLITHNYTMLEPNGKASAALFGIAALFGAGPWIKKAFTKKRYPTQALASKGKMVMKQVLMEFSDTLVSLAKNRKYFHVINSQNMKLEKHLVDEIHLDHTGCTILAVAIMAKLDDIL